MRPSQSQVAAFPRSSSDAEPRCRSKSLISGPTAGSAISAVAMSKSDTAGPMKEAIAAQMQAAVISTSRCHNENRGWGKGHTRFTYDAVWQQSATNLAAAMRVTIADGCFSENGSRSNRRIAPHAAALVLLAEAPRASTSLGRALDLERFGDQMPIAIAVSCLHSARGIRTHETDRDQQVRDGRANEGFRVCAVLSPSHPWETGATVPRQGMALAGIGCGRRDCPRQDQGTAAIHFPAADFRLTMQRSRRAVETNHSFLNDCRWDRRTADSPTSRPATSSHVLENPGLDRRGPSADNVRRR